MIKDVKLSNILFVDIETVPQYPEYSAMPEKLRKFWDNKAKRIKKDNETEDETYHKAGIYAEFGKIVSIAFGYIRQKNDENFLLIKSISSTDEHSILLKFNKLLDSYFNSPDHYLCAHNGKEFDFPYIARRSLINGLQPANILNTPGAKPWEVKHLDTLELWKFGDYKHWTSLDLLAEIFGIPTSKDEMDGSDVWRVYWQENNLQKIDFYCRKDVVVLTQLFLKFNNLPIIKDENIIFK